MCKGSGQNTVTQNSQPPPQVMAAYQDLMNKAQGVAGQPYMPYLGPNMGYVQPYWPGHPASTTGGTTTPGGGTSTTDPITGRLIGSSADVPSVSPPTTATTGPTQPNIPAGLTYADLASGLVAGASPYTALAQGLSTSNPIAPYLNAAGNAAGNVSGYGNTAALLGANANQNISNFGLGAGQNIGGYGLGAGQNISQFGLGAGQNISNLATNISNAGPQLQQFNGQTVGQYMSPYTQNVIGSTLANINQSNAIDQNNLLGKAIASGNAFGGDRAGVAAAELARNQDLAKNQVIAGLENQNYAQALGQFNIGNQQALAGQQLALSGLGAGAQYGLAGLGTGAQTGLAGLGAGAQYGLAGLEGGSQLGLTGQQLGMSGAGTSAGLYGNLGQLAQGANLAQQQALYTAGQTQQQQQQNQLNAAYQMYQQGLAYPYQQTGWLGNLVEGTAGLMGGTSATTSPAPSTLSQIGGGLLGGVGLLGSLGVFSDVRAKDDVKPIGKTFDDQTLYSFRYKGEPTTHVGLLAHEVEKRHPEAVGEVSGLKTVDYDAATRHAADRGHFDLGGSVQPMAFGGMPIGLDAGIAPLGMPVGPMGILPSFIPTPQQRSGRAGIGLPKPPDPYKDTSMKDFQQQVKDAAPGLKQLGISLNTKSPLDITPDNVSAMPSDFSTDVLPGLGSTGLDPIYYRGGIVPHMADGGDPDVSSPETQDNLDLSARSNDLGAVQRAIYGQESNYGQNNRTSVTGAVGPMQIQPETWAQYARPGEDIRNPEHNAQVGNRIISDLYNKYGGDPARVAVGYFSGPGNVAPAGSPTPWVKDVSDPTGKTVSSYVNDVTRRISGGAGQTAGLGQDGDIMSQYQRIMALQDEASQRARSQYETGQAPAKIDPWMALATAGFGMMAGTSPFAGVNIGQGALAGLQNVAQQRKANVEQYNADLRAKQLADIADQARRQLAAGTYEKLLATQEQKRQHDLTLRTPVGLGTFDPKTFGENKGIWVPNKEGGMDLWPLIPDGKGGTQLGPSPIGHSLWEGAAQTQPPTQQAPQGPPKLQSAAFNPDAGVININAQQIAQGHNYAEGTPVMEKGFTLPPPQSVGRYSSAAIAADGENYLQTGRLPPVARGNSPVAREQQAYRVAVLNYGVSLAASRGMTAEELIQSQRSAPGMLRFVLGADGRSTVSLGTAVRHLDTLQEYAKAWAANDTQTINRIRSVISREFGSDAATNLETVSKIVGPEIIKAIGVAGAGTEDDRRQAAAQFSSVQSPAQLLGAAVATQKLLGGQLEGKKRQAAEAGVNEAQFRRLVGERPYEILTNIDKNKGAAPATPAPVARPTLSQFLDAAKKANPGTNEQALIDYYNKKYGTQ